MSAKKTLLIWMTSLGSVFASAAQDNRGHAQTLSAINTYNAALAPQKQDEKRIDFAPGVESDLRAIAAKSIWRLSLRGEFSLVKQIWGMEDVLYYGLPIPVWNRIVTSLNDAGDRDKIIKALDNIVTNSISKDKKVAKQARDDINSWEKDPLSFARFLGGAVGKDFVQDTKPLPAPSNKK